MTAKTKSKTKKGTYVVRYYEPGYGWAWTREMTHSKALVRQAKIKREGFKAHLRRVL